MGHTKEPWVVIAVDNNYEIYSKAEEYDVAWSIDSVDNACRIVNCVNGCEGIPDEELDRFFKWARGMWFRQEKLIKEEQEKLAQMTDKEKYEYRIRRKETLNYNLEKLKNT